MNSERGKVTFFKWMDDDTGYFGFVMPRGCTDKTEAIRFTDRAVVGTSPALGDDVEYTLRPMSEGSRRQCATSIRRV